MKPKPLLLTLLLSCAYATDLTITIEPTAVGRFNATFFGLTADSSSFIMPTNPRAALLLTKPLRTMLAGLAPLTLRVGGTFTDFTVMPGPHNGVSPMKGVMQYNFSQVAWDAVNTLCGAMHGCQLVVSLNGLLRQWGHPDLPWDPTNAAAFIQDNIKRGYHIYGYELGNEPGCWGSHGGNVPANEHARDFAVLQSILAEAYPHPGSRPLVIGPDTTGCGGETPTSAGFLRNILSNEPQWNVTTVHIYSVTPQATVAQFLEATQSNEMCRRAATQLTWLRNSSLAGTPMWNGEGGGSYLTTGGGGYLHQFGGALSLLNNLGCLAVAGVKKLLKHDLFENMFVPPKLDMPYPPFWSAFLFKKLVQSAEVWRTVVNGAPQGFHAYTFLPVGGSTLGGERFASSATLILLNLDRRLQASVRLPESLERGCACIETFAITSSGTALGDSDAILNAPAIALNGKELSMTTSGDLPELVGRSGNCEQALDVGPLSAMIVTVAYQ